MKLQSIRVEQAEGRVNRMVDKVVSTYDEAFSVLHDISWDNTGPSYFKVDLTATFDNEQSYQITVDVHPRHSPHNNFDVAGYFARRFEAIRQHQSN